MHREKIEFKLCCVRSREFTYFCTKNNPKTYNKIVKGLDICKLRNQAWALTYSFLCFFSDKLGWSKKNLLVKNIKCRMIQFFWDLHSVVYFIGHLSVVLFLSCYLFFIFSFHAYCAMISNGKLYSVAWWWQFFADVKCIFIYPLRANQHMVAWWLVLLPHSMKVLGSNPPAGWGCLCGACIFSLCLYGFSSGTLASSHIHGC